MSSILRLVQTPDSRVLNPERIIFMSDCGAPDLQSHNESQSTPASSVTSVGHDSQDSRLRDVDIDKMR